MSTSTIAKNPDTSLGLTITIPWAEIQKTYEAEVDKLVEASELPGFRKGKAPRKLVEEKLDKTKVYESVLKDIIPKVYNEAIATHKIHPIISPKVELKEAQEGKDWVLIAHTCEKPSITLGNYKQAVTDLKSSKQKKIWLPGEEPKKEEEGKESKPTLDELLKAVYNNVQTTLPSLLLENEVNRLLSDLIDQTKKLGLTIEQYLSSTGKTAESIRAEYEAQARRTLTLEFALEELADKEGVLVSDDDIDAVIKTAKTEDEKTSLAKERYYLASVLRRQKTLDFLASL